jgi:hypothetical protein
MRKSLIHPDASPPSDASPWLDLEAIAHVQISSEDDLFPIEQALGRTVSTGWRASLPGPQIIRLVFDDPIKIRRVQIHFIERTTERSQEFALYAETVGSPLHELRRQQFTFSPNGSTEEIEDFELNLAHVTMLELRIDPDRSHDPKLSHGYATLAALRIA